MSLKQKLLGRLEAIDSSPKRSLGQNFLINPHVVEKIIKEAKSSSAVECIEIGPGLGSLTDELVLLGMPLRLVEMDQQFVKYWQSQDMKVEDADALHLDWDDFGEAETILVSNLPYQISARLVVELSSQASWIGHMVLMFQKEVAERITAKPRTADYGFLSVVTQLAWDLKKVVDASPQDFYPPPKVASRVLAFHRISTLPPGFIAFVKKAFENRRKFMVKNFSDIKDKIVLELQRLGYTEKVRAEEITPTHYMELYFTLKKDS